MALLLILEGADSDLERARRLYRTVRTPAQLHDADALVSNAWKRAKPVLERLTRPDRRRVETALHRANAARWKTKGAAARIAWKHGVDPNTLTDDALVELALKGRPLRPATFWGNVMRGLVLVFACLAGFFALFALIEGQCLPAVAMAWAGFSMFAAMIAPSSRVRAALTCSSVAAIGAAIVLLGYFVNWMC